jgi:hypothetical protein
MDLAVKIFSILLAATLSATAAPSDPGRVALDFLEKVRVRNLNLEPGGDTAISPQTADEKKASIARRLDRMASDLGNAPLEVAAVKLDENYAGVLVRKLGGFDPSRLQVFAVALVKRGADWTVAPVPASFENAGAGYAILLRKRLKSLEDWMLREQVRDLQSLRSRSLAELRGKISSKISPDSLRQMSALEVVEKFVAACEQGDLTLALGLTGGLAAALPADWPLRLKSIERAISAGPAAKRPWRVFTAPEVLRVVVQQEEDLRSATVSIGHLDPAGPRNEAPSPRIELVHLELSKNSDGLWQINPPPAFLQDVDDAMEEADELMDADLLNAFPANYRASHPTTAHTTAELAQQALLEALRSPNLHALLALCRFPETPESARKACIQAAEVWKKLREPGSIRHAFPLALQAEDAAACSIFQSLSTRDPDRFDPQIFNFEKSEDGWHWVPKPSASAKAKFQAWTEAESIRGSKQWQTVLIPNALAVPLAPTAAAPTPEQARELAEGWISATRNGDFPLALGLTAVLDTPTSRSSALRNLGYEIQAARRAGSNVEITGIYPGKSCSAVAIKIGSGSKALHPLYPLVATDKGPRLLIEADLFASPNRSREYLNKTTFARLEKSLPAATLAELKDLMAQHQALTEKTSPKSAD